MMWEPYDSQMYDFLEFNKLVPRYVSKNSGADIYAEMASAFALSSVALGKKKSWKWVICQTFKIKTFSVEKF